MSLRALLRNNFKSNFVDCRKLCNAAPNIQKEKRQCIISCKRQHFDHYTNTKYNKFEEIPLVSKGWNHSKSKGDYFTVNPIKNTSNEQIHSFHELGIDSNLIAALKNEGIHKATEFQSRVISKVLAAKHCLIAAETGCGKTLSYLLPIVQSLIGKKSEEMNTPSAVILLPNRELAYQVGEVASMLCKAVNLNAGVVVGGRTKQIMLNPEFKEIDILVATPGALSKLSTVGIYRLNKVKYTVLDEADTLIDDSFVEKMETLIKRVSQSQILLVSATLPKKLPDILLPYQNELNHVISARLHKPLLNISQKFLRLTKSTKPSHLLHIAKANKNPMVVFVNKNETSNWLALFLRENNIPCSNINGDMHYAIRIQQWNDFVSGRTQILSSTDIGSRGLNTIQLTHVLNYDFPLYAADYIHRIGRVGRLGSPKSCKVTNLICSTQEVSLVQQIEYAIRRDEALTNVDGNITKIVQHKIMKRIREAV